MSDRDSWNNPLQESGSPPPVPKKGMSGCLLATLIVGGITLVGGLVCCGGGAWLIYNIAPTVSQESEVVKAVSRQILSTEIPADFVPKSSIVMDNMFFVMRIAEFSQKEGKGEMMIGTMKIKFDANQPNAQSAQFRGNFEEKIRNSIDITKTEIQKITIDGKEVPVTIGEGTHRESGKAFHTLSADFDQPSGKTFVLLQVEDEAWDQDAFLKMLEEAKPQ